MKKSEVILLYDYKMQLPIALFENGGELAAYLNRTKEMTRCGICRFKKGIQGYITDEKGHRYQPYIIDLREK